MKTNSNVLDKLVHYTENATTGIKGHEPETDRNYAKHGTAGNSTKNKHGDKHFSEANNWTANKRKTKP